MARPTKLTPEIAVGILTLIKNAVHPVAAAEAFGVARSTYYGWIERGLGIDPVRPMEPIYAEFADAVAQAEAQAESTLVGMAIAKVRTTGDAVMLLERRFQERWQKREEITVNFRREAEKLAAETGLDPEELMAEAERIFAAART